MSEYPEGDITSVRKLRPAIPPNLAQLDLFKSDMPEVGLGGQPPRSPEQYAFDPERAVVVRNVKKRDGSVHVTEFDISDVMTADQDPSSAFDAAWLRSKKRPSLHERKGTVRLADLFSGCGGLSLGIVEAGRALGLEVKPVLAADIDSDALSVYSSNFPGVSCIQEPIESLLDGDLGSPLGAAEKGFLSRFGSIDILAGGPPCQGHSDLNNWTRRNDPKNELYTRMVRFAEIFEPESVIIENVPAVIHDRGGVLQRASDFLCKMGYRVNHGTLSAVDFGVPQSRKRHFLVASRSKRVVPELALAVYHHPHRSVRWAIEDLQDIEETSVFDTSAKHSSRNVARIDYLFDHGIYDLPDEQRPDCHRLKSHSYKSVYGRQRWDEPAPTITGGFGSTGQGRFVHPEFRRSLTPHEAARLQFFPDFFVFQNVGRRSLQQLIGNAVPSKLAYVIALELLR